MAKIAVRRPLSISPRAPLVKAMARSPIDRSGRRPMPISTSPTAGAYRPGCTLCDKQSNVDNRQYTGCRNSASRSQFANRHGRTFSWKSLSRMENQLMKTELRFTDDRVPHVAILWDQSSTFHIRIDGQTVDTFCRYGSDQQTPCTLEQAQQTALQWFDEVCAVHA